jgi:hypothetical protein
MHEDEVERTVADHLVGDRIAAEALHVADRVHAAACLELRTAVERDVLPQDPALELADPRRRLEPELRIQSGAEVAVGGQRVGVATRAVEREHELLAQALAQRVAPRERLELADEIGMAAECEVYVHALLEAEPIALLEIHSLHPGEWL